jgi:hypothetical protein
VGEREPAPRRQLSIRPAGDRKHSVVSGMPLRIKDVADVESSRHPDHRW